jgi:hypothetical protein
MDLFWLNGTKVQVTDMWLDLGDPENYSDITTINFTWYPSTENYKMTLIFTSEGNYPFTIWGTDPNQEIYNTTGVFLVREPYEITIEGYETKTLDPYENDFAYVIAEIPPQYKTYNPTLESFITPIFFKYLYGEEVFYAPYRDGSATLTLWEKDIDYHLRLVDGEMTFPNTYSQPNITKTYGTNIYLGEYNLNGTDMTYQVLLDERDIHQYRWLFNWVFIIALFIIIVISAFMFFIIPEMPWVSFSFGIGGTIMLVIFRISIWLWKSW